jgi:indolepyruvate decarboxylase
MNVGEALLTALKEAGAKAIFGIPGDYALSFFDIIDTSHILPLYTFSHEPAVGYAADAAARHGGGIGVAVVTYGAGALSLINAVACAWSEKSPLVIISGAPGTTEFGQDLLLHHQIRNAGSQLRIFEELTCARTVLDDPATAPQEISRVLSACRRHSRPVYIELPRNMADQPCQPVQLLSPEAPDMTAIRN